MSLLLAVGAGQSMAQEHAFPDGPVTVVVPFPAGGRSDIAARMLAARLQAEWGVPVIVTNRPGAGGSIGSRAVADAKPDGHTLLFTTSALLSAQYAVDKAPRTTDFQALGIVEISYPVVVARKGLGFSLKNLSLPGGRSPGELTIATVPGAAAEVAAEGFLFATHLDMRRIPFKGETDTLAALLGGHIDVATSGWSSVQGHVRAGTLDVLAVAAPARVPEFPQVPTFREFGLDLNLEVFQGFFAPAGTPRSAATRIEAAIARAMANQATIGEMRQAGLSPRYLDAGQMRRFITRQDIQFRDIVVR